MKIRRLTLKNFRGFEDATVDLDRPLTVLFGVNGSGKSSVLQACGVALSRVALEAAAFADQGKYPWYHQAEDTDIRLGAKAMSVAAELSNGGRTGEALVHYPDQIASLGLSIGLLTLQEGAPALAVFFSASRGLAGMREALAPRPPGANDVPDDPSSATHDALVAGDLRFRSFFQWFKAREDIENELKVSRRDLTLEDPQLSAVRRAVAGMLPGFSGLRIQRDPLHMVVQKGDTLLALDQLSDGEKLLLALTADLARRLAMTHPERDPLQGEAVVLIDEIELHLHPSWQRRVLGALRRTFPSCQIIVTTHSPQVLSEVPNDAVLLVHDFQIFRPPAPTEGRDSSSILWEVFGVPARPEPFVQQIDAISSKLDAGHLDEARTELDRLARAVTERDPEVTRLRGLLDVVERLDADPGQGA